MQKVYPNHAWARSTPEEQGLDPVPIREMDQLMRKAEANGLLVRNGYVVVEWNYGTPMEVPVDVKSITKSFTSLVLGLALDDALIASLDTRVKDVHPGFEAGPFTDDITFRHLATMSAGIKSVRPWGWYYLYRNWLPPEVAMVYNSDQPVYLARALTYLYSRTLLSVLKERILDPIGAAADWRIDGPAPWSTVVARDGSDLPVNMGWGGMRCTAGDLARVGYLFLNAGCWDGEQLISDDYIRACWSEIPLKPFSPEKWGNGYGLYWWRLVPGVWYMAGLGDQFCVVDAVRQLVMVKVNKVADEPPLPMNSPKTVGLRRFYPLLHQATTGERFNVPKAWRVGWRAIGRLPEDWDISLESGKGVMLDDSAHR
jgi:CubicO group peptidase (beta-lactamase class C family)